MSGTATSRTAEGKLLIANFAPGIPDRGYMEAMMSWWLLYRNEEDMQALVDVPDGLVERITIERDPFDAVGLLRD